MHSSNPIVSHTKEEVTTPLNHSDSWNQAIQSVVYQSLSHPARAMLGYGSAGSVRQPYAAAAPAAA